MLNKKNLRFIFLFLSLFLFSKMGCSCNGFPIPTLPQSVVGSCTYTNSFSGSQECKDYVGGWTVEESTKDCAANGSKIVLEQKCGIAKDKKLGDCIFIIDESKEKYARVELPGTDKEKCAGSKRGCEFFGGGAFDPTELCGGLKPTDNPTTGVLPTFIPGELTCKEPRQGEPAGNGPNGKVCTLDWISGATEPGRDFSYYGDCKVVRTQRPYYPVPPEPGFDKVDPRMDDKEYVKETEWVKAQIKATACVCCHTSSAPNGASKWSLDAGPNWINSMSSRALAMGAGWMDGVGFGAFPKEKNNGFSRPTPNDPNHSIFTTTDDPRIKKFFENELKHRGKTKEEFKNETYIAGPLDIQRAYKPKACTDEQTIDANGVIKWTGGDARYLYVLEADSTSPATPPNLDTPEGTLWRIDVDAKTGTPLKSGEVTYAKTSSAFIQKVPLEGNAKTLQKGKTYYLYVLKDIAFPLTRCLFTAK